MEDKINISLPFNRKQLFGFLFLLIGFCAIGVGAYLVQTKQLFRSRASQEVYGAFEITQVASDGSEKGVSCVGSSCTTESLDLNFKVKDLEPLLQ